MADVITETGAFRRVPWSQTRPGRLWLIRIVSCVFLSVVVGWPLLFGVRFIAVQTGQRPGRCAAARWRGRMSWWARAAALAACGWALWFEVSLTLVELRLHPFATLYGLPAPVCNLLRWLPVFMILALGLTVFSVLAWRHRLWSLPHRVHYTLIPMAFALLLYVFYCQHLLFVT